MLTPEPLDLLVIDLPALDVKQFQYSGSSKRVTLNAAWERDTYTGFRAEHGLAVGVETDLKALRNAFGAMHKSTA